MRLLQLHTYIYKDIRIDQREKKQLGEQRREEEKAREAEQYEHVEQLATSSASSATSTRIKYRVQDDVEQIQ